MAHLGVTGDLSGLAVRNDTAVEHLAAGRLRGAVTELESLLNDCRWRLGAEHPETLVVEGNLAVTYVVNGQEEQGTQLMLANLATREQVFGDEHVLTLTARDAVAATHRLAGRLSEAMWLYSQVAPQRNRVLGPVHPHTLTTRLGLGLTFADAGDPAMARDVLTAALQDCERAGVAQQHSALLRSCLADLHDAPAAPDAGPAVSGPVVPGPAVSGPVVADPAVSGPAVGLSGVPRQRIGPEPATRGSAAWGRDGLLTIDIGSASERIGWS